MKAMSRQRRWQLRQLAKGKCPMCAGPLDPNLRTCAKCGVARRERGRRENGFKRRYRNSKTYNLTKG